MVLSTKYHPYCSLQTLHLHEFSIRRPFLITPLIDSKVWWFTLFTQRLTDEIKLIGPTIRCAVKPHVQSYVLVTDQTGLNILRGKESTVFRCHKGYDDASLNGEVTASQLILKANYSPIFNDGDFDEISHDPYELVFVKFKGQPPYDTNLERRAAIYQK